MFVVSKRFIIDKISRGFQFICTQEQELDEPHPGTMRSSFAHYNDSLIELI